MLSQRGKFGTTRALTVKDLLAAALLAMALLTSALFVAARPADADSVRDAQQWVLDDLRAPHAWESSQGRGIMVAVLDSGVYPAVSDLAGSVATGPDYTQTGTAPWDPHWGEHGTWMASLIAGHGHGDGTSGLLGVAPQSKILSIRVITDRDDPGYEHYQHEPPDTIQDALASAIRYAVDHGAAVISMSIGYSEPSTAVRSALQYAYDHGTVVVASSGNSGEGWFARTHSYAPYSFPADYPGVLAVGAADRNGARAGFSSDNLSVQVAAPGVNVPAQGRDGQYWQVSGTSPACALVAGAVALIKASYPALSPALVGEAIVSTTHDRPRKGYDERVGFGMVDATAALARAKVLARNVPAGGLVGSSIQGGQAVTSPDRHFGGGPAHAAVPPVRPRGMWSLVGFGLLGLTSLILVVASLIRIASARRSRRYAADDVGAAGDWAPGGSAARPEQESSAGQPGGVAPPPVAAPPAPAPGSSPPSYGTSPADPAGRAQPSGPDVVPPSSLTEPG
jgi:subtilisin family serine protease